MGHAFKAQLLLLHRSNVRKQRNIVLYLAGAIAHRADRPHVCIDLTALAPIPDLPFPVTALCKLLPHILVELRRMVTGLQNARRLADRVFAGKTSDPGKAVINIDDDPVRITDDDPLPGMGKNTGRKLQIDLYLFALGHLQTQLVVGP